MVLAAVRLTTAEVASPATPEGLAGSSERYPPWPRLPASTLVSRTPGGAQWVGPAPRGEASTEVVQPSASTTTSALTWSSHAVGAGRAVTGEETPASCWVFPDNTAAASSVHGQQQRIRARVLLCFLRLSLVRPAEIRTQRTWPRICQERRRLVPVDVSGATSQASQNSNPTPAQTQLLGALQLPAPVLVRADSSPGQP